jgi:hydroxymethylbilane synthase
LLKPIDNVDVHRCLDVERFLLYKLNAGCSAAVGGLATIESGELTMQAVVLDKNGATRLTASGRSMKSTDDEMMVGKIVEDLFARGARALIGQ